MVPRRAPVVPWDHCLPPRRMPMMPRRTLLVLRDHCLPPRPTSMVPRRALTVPWDHCQPSRGTSMVPQRILPVPRDHCQPPRATSMVPRRTLPVLRDRCAPPRDQCPPPEPQSRRNARTGLRWLARRAGRLVAKRATAARTSGASHEGQRIGRADADQQARHQARQPESGPQADRHADADRDQSLAHHHPQHVPGRGAESHADPDLARPLVHQVGQHAVDPHGREHQCQESQAAHQGHIEAVGADRTRHDPLHGHHIGDWLLGVDRPDLLLHRLQEAGLPTVRAHGQGRSCNRWVMRESPPWIRRAIRGWGGLCFVPTPPARTSPRLTARTAAADRAPPGKGT